MLIVLKSGILNLLEPSGPLQASTGIALPLPLLFLFIYYYLHLHWSLTLNLLTTTIVAPPSNVSKWQMGFNSAFKGLSYVNLNLLTTTIVAPPSNVSKWQMGFNSAFKGLKQLYCATVDEYVL